MIAPSLQAPTPALILASASPARRALLAACGLVFRALPAAVDEQALKQAARREGASAGDAALLLAETKAQRLSRRNPEALVIGADQILVQETTWFDKPIDKTAARAQLQTLRGQWHVLETAVICVVAGQRVWHHLARPRLHMRSFSEAALEAYLAIEGEHLTGSVGAYRLEGPGALLFDRVEGEHSAILGLPLLPLLGFLRQRGVLLD